MFLLYQQIRTDNEGQGDLESDVVHCLNEFKSGNIRRWRQIVGFRNTEILIFYMQTFSLMIYLLLCWVFVKVKTFFANSEDRRLLTTNDPFLNLLVHGQNDFFKQESQVMIIFTLQLTCLLVGCFQNTNIFKNFQIKEDESWSFYYKIKKFCIPINSLIIIFWMILIWQGSGYEKLFRRRNLSIMTAIIIADLVLIIYCVSDGFIKL